MIKYSKQELETMAYDDIAYIILKEEQKPLNLQNLFKKVCSLLELSESIFQNKIVDFFELVSTDRRFIMLENGEWDLRDNHSQKIKITADDDIEEIDATEETEELDETEATEESTEDDNVYYDEDDIDDDTEEDLADLVIVDEDSDSTDIL